MRIALTGSGGTGKTVTALEIARLMKWEYINSQARFVFEELKTTSMENNQDQDPEKFLITQERILERQIAYELEVTQRTPNWIAERTVMDSAAYATFWASAMPVAADGVWRKRHESIKNRALGIVNRSLQHAVAGSYDRVFVMPFGRVPLKGDIFRSGDALYQRTIDLMMVGLVMRKLADRTTIVPHLEAGETDTALWIIKQAGLEPVLPKSQWYTGLVAREDAKLEEINKLACEGCTIMGRKHEATAEGKCSHCGAQLWVPKEKKS